MVWIDNINNLSYYKHNKTFPCYCEKIVEPKDILLQAYIGNFPINIWTSFNVTIGVYSPDGITFYEDASTYFVWSAVHAPNGDIFVNIQLNNNFSPGMYAHGNFILRVSISATSVSGTTQLFDKFTEQYCIPCCPLPPSDITIDDGTVVNGEYSPIEYGKEYYNIT